jgi:hypothetical protein
MSPGGHLVTTLAAGATGAAYSHSWPLVAGIAAGGFLIDVDHAVDYVLFDGQRDLRPGAFLRYYLNGHMRRTVLMLHSWELFAALGVTAWVTGWPWLVGWLVGGLMHLALDLIFNGRLTPRSIVLFTASATGPRTTSTPRACSASTSGRRSTLGSGVRSSSEGRIRRPACC